MKKFKWNDAPKGTTHRCTHSDTWIRMNAEVTSFWNIGSEQWEASGISPHWGHSLMKMPELMTATKLKHEHEEDIAKMKPGSFEPVNVINDALIEILSTEMMLTRPTLFFGNREGTQMMFPARTLVTVVGQVSTGLVLYHKSTMRHAVVDKSAIKHVMTEEQELVEEAIKVVGEYCDDVTVEKLIKAGYRKQPESSGRFTKGQSFEKNPGREHSNEPGAWVACINDNHGSHMQIIGCNSNDQAHSEELRDYVMSRL